MTRELIYDGIYGPLLGLPAGPGRIGAARLESYISEADRQRTLEAVREAMQAGEGAQFRSSTACACRVSRSVGSRRVARYNAPLMAA